VDEIPTWMRPKGWFQLAWSPEIGTNEIKPFRCFGHEVVLYRSDDGQLHGLDAHCQHLGAHLGYGGRVAGDCVVCPFHGWSWGPDGTHRGVPDSDEINRSRRIRRWETCERNGLVYIWHDVEGGAPEWEVPDLFDVLDDGVPTLGFHAPYPNGCFRYEDVEVQPRVAAENIVDPAHFKHVHHTKQVPTLVDHEIGDSYFRTQLRAPSRGKRDGTSTETPDTVTLVNYGVGVSYTRFAGRDNTHGVFCATPVDDERSTLFQTLWLEELPAEDADATQARMAAVSSVYPEDIEIWRHQVYLDPPGLIAAEAKLFGALRRWCRQFEPAA
jgi:3-ketosteroid 9alpha-monooxygenase subunit A